MLFPDGISPRLGDTCPHGVKYPLGGEQMGSRLGSRYKAKFRPSYYISFEEGTGMYVPLICDLNIFMERNPKTNQHTYIACY